MTEKNKHSLRKKFGPNFLPWKHHWPIPLDQKTSQIWPSDPKRAPGGPWGPLGAQNPQMPIFRGKYFFLLPFNWVLKNNPNESKKTKKLGIFRSVTPKNCPEWLGLPMVSRRPNFEFLYFFWSQIYHFVMAINFDCDEDRFWFFSDGIEPLYLGQG